MVANLSPFLRYSANTIVDRCRSSSTTSTVNDPRQRKVSKLERVRVQQSALRAFTMHGAAAAAKLPKSKLLSQNSTLVRRRHSRRPTFVRSTTIGDLSPPSPLPPIVCAFVGFTTWGPHRGEPQPPAPAPISVRYTLGAREGSSLHAVRAALVLAKSFFDQTTLSPHWKEVYSRCW